MYFRILKYAFYEFYNESEKDRFFHNQFRELYNEDLLSYQLFKEVLRSV